MDIQAITSFISNVGFPIACCAMLFWRMMKQDEVHKEEIDSMRTALEGNTLVLTEIKQMLGGDN